MGKKKIIIIIMVAIILLIVGIIALIKRPVKYESDVVKNYGTETVVDGFVFYAGFLSGNKDSTIYSFLIRNDNNEVKSIDRIIVYFCDDNDNIIDSMWYSNEEFKNISPGSSLPVDMYKEVDLRKTSGVKYEIKY